MLYYLSFMPYFGGWVYALFFVIYAFFLDGRACAGV